VNIQKAEAGSIAQEVRAQELQKARIEQRPDLPRFNPAGRSADQLQVSERGRNLQKLSETLQQQMQTLPEVRQERVDAARARVQSGFFNDGQFNLKLAGKMLENSDLKQALNLTGDDVPQTDYRDKLMNDVKGKLESGFYSADAVMDFVADRLLAVYTPDEEGGEAVDIN
jgi:hypothetical protein